jgi:N-acetylglucosaminyldiphosphoundecaprenol N-acetyl-beta-D-mannosaminyltransferase
MISILGTLLHSVNYQSVVEQVVELALANKSSSIFCANVHMVMEAYDSDEFRKIFNSADIVTPDGMPLVWLMRMRGNKGQERVYGPTLMLRILEVAEKKSFSVGFLGGSSETLELLGQKMLTGFPDLNIAYQFSPPYQALSTEEDRLITDAIRKSGLKILFVGLGCPKQEKWIHAHKDRIPAVMVGVGAAFDFHTGMKKQAPRWMQRVGLEWFFRLMMEPGRLWKRYFIHNPRFVILGLFEQIHYWTHPKEKG